LAPRGGNPHGVKDFESAKNSGKRWFGELAEEFVLD